MLLFYGCTVASNTNRYRLVLVKRKTERGGGKGGRERKRRDKQAESGEKGIHRKEFSSVAQPCPTLCDPMNRSTPGLPAHRQLLEITQTHVHRVSDAIQSSHSLSSPSPPAPNPSQHQGLFQ